MIELRHLRYFVAVAEEGHLTRAAGRLGIQQPPLSQQIQALEREVGAPLFLRHSRGVALTDAGETLLPRARAILGDVDGALEAARRTARGQMGRLAVGFTSSAAFHPLVASLVRMLRQSAPEIVLSLEEGNTQDLIAALRANRLDTAFVRSPVGQPEDLVIEPLLSEAMVVALPDRHSLATPGRRKPPVIALRDLAGETFVLYRRPSGPGLYDEIIAACRAAGFSPHVGQEAPRMVSTLSLVAAGMGVSIIPESMARLAGDGIAYARLDGAIRLEAPLYLARRKAPETGALSRLIDYVRAWRPAPAS